MITKKYNVDPRCFESNAINVISVSGGKDSLAMWLMAISAGVDRRVVFADTGHEHQATYDYINYLESELGNIIRVKADFTERIEKKRQFILNKWPTTLVSECGLSAIEADKRIKEALDILHPSGIPFLDLCLWKGRFPSTRARFCTQELKHEPVKKQIFNPLLEEFDEVISWVGVRAQESPARANLPKWEEDAIDIRGLNVYRPILDLLHDDVFNIAKDHNIKPNPLYKMGFSRVGCFPCINCRKTEFAEMFRRFPEEISRLSHWERLVSKCSRNGNSVFVISTLDPTRAESDTKKISVDTFGIESYRNWSMTTRGGRQYDLLWGAEDLEQCSSVYTGVCE